MNFSPAAPIESVKGLVTALAPSEAAVLINVETIFAPIPSAVDELPLELEVEPDDLFEEPLPGTMSTLPKPFILPINPETVFLPLAILLLTVPLLPESCAVAALATV